MGRMLDVLRQAGGEPHGEEGTSPAEDDFVSDFANEEVPYIEVGPARSVEGSPAVLGAEPPRLRILPRPPADLGPILDPVPAPAPPAHGVCFRPVPANLALLPPEQRFAGAALCRQPGGLSSA
jgi:hypothetical protein